MNRLEQDAAEVMAWHEKQAFKQSVRARWDKAKPKPYASVWAPTITEQERVEREQQIAAGLIPF